MNYRRWPLLLQNAQLIVSVILLLVVLYIRFAPRPVPPDMTTEMGMCYRGRAESKRVFATLKTEDGGEIFFTFPKEKAMCR